MGCAVALLYRWALKVRHELYCQAALCKTSLTALRDVFVDMDNTSPDGS